jgi:DNA-binding response OmpR family regulator
MNKLLLVEDDPQYRTLLSEGLKAEGIDVLTATNGEEALGVLKNAPDIRLIVLDLIMPQMDGMTFFYHLKQTLKVSKPVLILSNLNDTAVPTDSDIVEYIVKSNISLADLIKRIRFHLLPQDTQPQQSHQDQVDRDKVV